MASRAEYSGTNLFARASLTSPLVPSLRIILLESVPKTVDGLRDVVVVIFKESNASPLRRVTISFSVFSSLAQPEDWFLWVNNLKTIRREQYWIVPVWLRPRIVQYSVGIRFNAKHLVHTTDRQ